MGTNVGKGLDQDLLARDLLLVCAHGMSEKSFVCSYKDMIASNEQLQKTKSKFFLASDGLVHLRNRIVFVAQ